MKKSFLLLLAVISLCACGKEDTVKPEANQQTDTQIQSEVQPQEKGCKISGSFTVTVHEVIPDYGVDSDIPGVAVVTEFQSHPFTIRVGEEIGRKLIDEQADNVFVFTIEPIEVDCSKEDVQKMELSSIVWEFPVKIKDYRVAEENELGLESLHLTIE